MFNDRHTRFAADTFDQALTTTRHDDINVTILGQQGADRRAIDGIDNLHRSSRQASKLQTRVHAVRDQLI